MKANAKKTLVVVIAMVAMTLGSGAMDAAAANPNQLRAWDGAESTAVAVAGVTNLETVPQGRYRIGFLPE